MNEAERLAYLNAMGIESYIPRMTLPGALPSELCELPELSQISESESSGVSHSVFSSGKDALKQLQANLTVPTTTETTITTTNISKKNHTEQGVAELQRTSVATTTQGTTQMTVRFHWVIFQPDQAMLLLIPSAHTDQRCMELLKKILSAIGVVAPLTQLENFVWPPALSGSSQHALSMNSLNDARETLGALLEGYQLKQQKSQAHLKQVLVFDENMGKTLFDGVSISGLQLRILPSLQLMLTSSPEKVAELKRVAWQRLVDLKV